MMFKYEAVSNLNGSVLARCPTEAECWCIIDDIGYSRKDVTVQEIKECDEDLTDFEELLNVSD